MNLGDLIDDQRTSLNEGARGLIDQPAFRRDLRHLERYGFWSPARRGPSLWDHQKAAIGTVVAYLRGDKAIPERPEHTEAALLKLPTGTGKSGVIAVLARCLPEIRKVLVLTPREALTKQLLRDIRFRFWKNIGYNVEHSRLFTASADDLGAELETAYTETLLPSKCAAISAHLNGADRVVLVGTHQSLDAIRRTAEDANDPASCVALDILGRIRQTFDLIVVDEGHYEPAVSWSRGVREFNLPTVLLSATPYRNDYKSFRIRGRYLFNYPYEEAVGAGIIRPVEIVIPAAAHAGNPRAAVAQFVRMLEAELRPRLGRTTRWFAAGTVPKIMVRADDLDTLVALQAAIDRSFATRSVVIHDRAVSTPQNRNLFQSVSSAQSARPDAQFWIHQFKLMEGIDDASFVAVAIYDLMSNARQLVQQIGRVTRQSDGDRRVRQVGWVFASEGNARRIKTLWDRYTAYESYAAENVGFIVTNEVTLPDRLLEHMAQYQYIDGEFRGRFELEAPLAAVDIQLSQSAAVLKVETPLRDVRQLASAIEEAILDKDRFKITPISELPNNAVGFSYYAWRNSPLLIERFFSEWRLGIFIAVRHGDFVFMHVTEGLVVDTANLGLARADRSVMEKAFSDGANGNAPRLSRLSFSSLEMSQSAIRRMAVRTRSFADVFTDLLDPSLVPATAFGFIDGRARYLGFVRSRIRDASERLVPIPQYIVESVARELADANRKRHGVFGRYAQVIGQLPPEEAAPVSVLLDFAGDSFIDAQEDKAAAAQAADNEEPDYDDLCADVDAATGEFTIKIGGTDVPCSIQYRPDNGKYRLASDKLNELFPAKESGDRRRRQTIVQRLNQDQAFRIIVESPGVVYSEGRFYKPRMRWTVDGGGKPVRDFVSSAASLGNVTLEKGERHYARARDTWHRTSIFGLLGAACDGRLRALGIPNDALTQAIKAYPVWLCDDDTRESADFIGVDEANKKLVFLHAKTGKQGADGTGFNVTSLQEVGRQALASLAFMSRGEPSTVWARERWESDVQANRVRLRGRNRIFRAPARTSAADLNQILARAIHNPSFEREIWLVCAKTVRRQALSDGLDEDPPENRLRQFLMHWDALQTACARASVRLRLYCD
jgi:Type III restriction enzyme, res subunit